MGKLITLFDDQGSTRKLFLGVNLSAALAQQSGEKALFVDLTLSGKEKTEHYSGAKTGRSVSDLIAAHENADGSMLKGYISVQQNGVAYLDGFGRDDKTADIEKLSQALRVISKTFSYTLVALPDESGPLLASLCALSNLILVSVYPHIISLTSAKDFIEKLGQWNLPLKAAKLIINTSGAKGSLDKSKIKQFLEINELAEIPYNENEMVDLINNGSVLTGLDSHGDFAVSLKKLSKDLLKNDIYADASESTEKIKTPLTGKEKNIDADIIKAAIHRELVSEMGAKQIDLKGLNDPKKADEIKMAVKKTVQEIFSRHEAELSQSERENIVNEIMDEALGLGSVEKLLKDPEITEIMVNGPNDIYVEKKGKIVFSGEHFLSSGQLMTVIDRIVSPIGRRVDESSPIVDARLSDGSRVNAIIPPLSLIGPVLTIRKFSQKKLSWEDLVGFGAMTAQMADFLRICVRLRKNIIVSGGTGSGKTTLLNVISSFIPEDERIVTIEDSAELKLPQKHVVRLESRPPSIEGKGEVPIRRLVINALRMRPDRIVVGECRGGETLDMLQAMNTGHDGSMTTIHANSPKDGLSRITTMVIMAGTDLPEKAIREQIGSAVQIMVQLSRLSDGSRRMTEISEVCRGKADELTLSTLFKYEQTGMKDGKVLGKFVAEGNLPTFIEEIEVHGLKLDKDIFKRGELR